MHGLLALMYPFRWQHIYVPLLPRMFLDYLTAPMPFVCGIHSSLQGEFEQLPTEEDLVIVKLNTNEVGLCGSVSQKLAPLPQSHMVRGFRSVSCPSARLPSIAWMCGPHHLSLCNID